MTILDIIIIKKVENRKIFAIFNIYNTFFGVRDLFFDPPGGSKKRGGSFLDPPRSTQHAARSTQHATPAGAGAATAPAAAGADTQHAARSTLKKWQKHPKK